MGSSIATSSLTSANSSYMFAPADSTYSCRISDSSPLVTAYSVSSHIQCECLNSRDAYLPQKWNQLVQYVFLLFRFTEVSPEVIRGHGYSYSCDWWSLGVIVYECFSGFVSTWYLLLPTAHYLLQIPAVCQRLREYFIVGGSLCLQF
jgi:hypothetical protein